MWNCAYPLSLWGLKPAKDWQAVRTKQSKFTPCVLLRTSASHRAAFGNSRMGRLASTKWCSYERSNTQVLRAASHRGCTAGVTLPCPLVGQRQSPCLGSDLPMHVLCGLEGSAQPGRHLERHPITDGKKNPPCFCSVAGTQIISNKDWDTCLLLHSAVYWVFIFFSAAHLGQGQPKYSLQLLPSLIIDED